MAAKEERPLSTIEKCLLTVVCLIAIASWFTPGSSWYDSILIFIVFGGLVVFIGDALHKRRQSAPTPAPLTPTKNPNTTTPIAPRKPRYSTDLAPLPSTPNLSNKTHPSEVLVCIHGFDEADTERMERLCKALGVTVSLQATPQADMAVVGPDSAFDFAGSNVPAFNSAAFADALHRALDSLPRAVPPPVKNNSTPPATSVRWSILDDAAAQSIKAIESARAPIAADDRITLPHTFSFNYRTSDGGNYGWREVNVYSVSSKGNHKYLEGYCQERQEMRTFRTDRIRGELRDMETGELIPVKRLLAEVPARAAMSYQPAPSPRTKRSTNKTWQTAVLFTGFATAKRENLEALAEDAGWSVRVSIGPTLDYLVTGPRAGPTKVRKAGELGVPIISEDEFTAML